MTSKRPTPTEWMKHDEKKNRAEECQKKKKGQGDSKIQYENSWLFLKQNMPTFCEKLRLTEVLVHLESKEILRPEQIQEIEAEATNYKKNYKLISILQTLSRIHCPTFCRLLVETGQSHLLENLNGKEAPIYSQLASDSCASSSNSNEPAIKASTFDAKPKADIGGLTSAVLAEKLKKIYKEKLRLVNPFSLPFTFDIENTWVSLSLRKGANLSHSVRMEDHNQLIYEAFQTDTKLLLIEGRAACGKTMLMRKIAFDWALDKAEIQIYTFVLLTEFRYLAESTFPTIANLILSGMKSWLSTDDEFQQLKELITDKNFSQSNRVLILLDGYDEAKSPNVCMELKNYLASSSPMQSLHFDVIITTRPGALTIYKEHKSRLNYAEVLGFDEPSQQTAYINAHFKDHHDAEEQIDAVETRLEESVHLRKIAETPLFLTFICLVHEKIKSGSVFELYRCIIWWLIDRYQRDHSDSNVPALFGYNRHENSLDLDQVQIEGFDEVTWFIIQNNFLDFPLLQKIGKIALEVYPQVNLSKDNLRSYQITAPAYESGIILKDIGREEFRIVTRYLFPHRTIQEFLAGGLFYFWSDSKVKANFHNITSDRQLTSFSDIPESEEMNEIEKFIWRSITTDQICSEIREYFCVCAYLYLDISLLPSCRSTDLAKILNACLKICDKVRKLTLENKSGIISKDEEYVVFDKQIDLSRMEFLKTLILGEQSNFIKFLFQGTTVFPIIIFHPNCLEKIEFNSLIFASSMVFCCTLDTLRKNTNSNATLQLRNVQIEINDQEGINMVNVTSDCHQLSEYFANDGQLKSPLVCELSAIFSNLACLESIILEAAAYKRCGSRRRRIEFPQLHKMKKLTFSNFHFDVEEELCFLFNNNILRTVEEIAFWDCYFSSKECLCVLLNHIAFRCDQQASVSLYDCSISFNSDDSVVKSITMRTIIASLSKYVEGFSDQYLPNDSFNEHCFNDCKHILEATNELELTGSNIETTLNLKVNLPPFIRVKKLSFTNFNFCKSETISIHPCTTQLAQLSFFTCKFSFSAVKSILHNRTMQKLVFVLKIRDMQDFDSLVHLLCVTNCAFENLGIAIKKRSPFLKNDSQIQTETQMTPFEITASLLTVTKSSKLLKRIVIWLPRSLRKLVLFDDQAIKSAGKSQNADFEFIKVHRDDNYYSEMFPH